MKRCFYIANSYDGSYFFVSDDVDEYFQKMAAYVLNLKNSQKLNHYSFGSVELTEDQYAEYRDGAGKLESSQIRMREKQDELSKAYQEQNHEDDETQISPEEQDEPKKPKRPHLRLV